MFRKLRWQFIITIMAITAAILLLSFLTIYTSAAHSFRQNSNFRPDRMPPRIEQLDTATRRAIDTQRKEFAEQSLHELIYTLIAVGSGTMLVVFIISYLITDRVVGGIEQTYLRQRQFIGNASHELRTPLATIDANLEAAIADSERPSQWLQRAKNESERMANLLTNLLILAGLENGTTPVTSTQEPISLKQIINDCLEPFWPQITARQLDIRQDITVERVHNSAVDKLQQLITILIDNAVKYTPTGGGITIVSSEYDDSIILGIKNSFRYIEAEELTNYFERFYQADASHHQSGSGLGLAIAKELASSMNIELSATSTAEALLFEMILPK